MILQFEIEPKNQHQPSITGAVDVKATSNDIEGSGKSPNITSSARIRAAYIKGPDLILLSYLSSIKFTVKEMIQPK